MEISVVDGTADGHYSYICPRRSNRIWYAHRNFFEPFGIIVGASAERSQLKNREIAMSILASKLKMLEEERVASEASGDRKSQIGTMDRSEKIRTFNFPQDRLTDHRIKKNWHNLDKIMAGYLDPIMEEFNDSSVA